MAKEERLEGNVKFGIYPINQSVNQSVLVYSIQTQRQLF